MMKLLKENLYLIALWILCAICLFVFTGHYSNILLDVGREVYYPERILQGKVLYKDLFNIYGPASYLWNALLYKLFGINLKTLYIWGAFCSFGIVTSVYLIAKRFLSDFLSFSIGVFTIVTGICSVHLFNYTFPYSWAMLYGTVLSLFSLLFLFKYKESDKLKYLYLSAFLSGSAAVCKYDFLLYALIVLGTVFQTKNIKTIIKGLCAFLIIPAVSSCILLVQGLAVTDILNSNQVIKNMLNTKSLDYFYRHSGVYFSFPILIHWIVNLIKAAIGFVTVLAGVFYYRKNLELSVILLITGGLLTYFLTNPAIFAYLIGVTIIFALLKIKTIKTVKLLNILILSAVALSMKSLWGLTPLNYGNYYCAIVLTAFFALLFTVTEKKLQTAAGIYMLIVSLWFAIFSIKQLPFLQYKIQTPYGSIYTTEEYGKPVDEILNLINSNNAQKMTVFPEGLIINFLSKNSRISDDYYNSLLPLYTETFGEQTLIKHFSENQPDYIIFTNQSMQDYNNGSICKDYALDFCASVYKNYKPEKAFGKDLRFFVFHKIAK